MRSHFQTVAINVLGTWSSRGNIEKYFKYRYSDFNYPIGSLTEYFKFVNPDGAQAVQHDLHSMKPKILSQVEQDILDSKPSPIEQALYTETKPLERSPLNQQHLQQVPESDVGINCSPDTQLDRVFLSSPSSVCVIEALYEGYSLRQAAEIASVPVNTARKVLAVLQRQ